MEAIFVHGNFLLPSTAFESYGLISENAVVQNVVETCSTRDHINSCFLSLSEPLLRSMRWTL